MKPNYLTYCLFLLTLIGEPTTTIADNMPPAPRDKTVFLLPITDGTNATAALLPTTDAANWLIYSTSTGRLGFYLLTNSTTPNPQPNPVPTPVPPVPTPTPQTPAALITVASLEKQRLPPQTAQRLTAAAIRYDAYTIAMVADPTTTTDALTWIGAAAGKQLPHTYLVDNAGKILWQGPTPTTDAAYAAVLDTIQPHTNKPLDCPDCRHNFSRGRRR